MITSKNLYKARWKEYVCEDGTYCDEERESHFHADSLDEVVEALTVEGNAVRIQEVNLVAEDVRDV